MFKATLGLASDASLRGEVLRDAGGDLYLRQILTAAACLGAETGGASVGARATSQLMIWSKRKSAAPSAGFCIDAMWAVSAGTVACG
jgi:hypothetical protein